MFSTSSLPRKLFRAKTPTYIYVISVGLLLLWNLYLKGTNTASANAGVSSPVAAISVLPSVEVVRSADYELIKPILFAEAKNEDPSLQPVKSKIEEAISGGLSQGK